MKSALFVPLFATAALAATSSLIPSGISDGCSSYLAKLNSNTTLAACTTPLVAATKAFQPGASSTNTTKAAINSALTTLCAPTVESACQSSTLRGMLADFYAACTPELTTSSNSDVVKMYDVLYALYPSRAALCSKSESGAFCAVDSSAISTGTASSAAPSASATAGTPALANGVPLSTVQAYLAETDNGFTTPNTTTFTSSNAIFLFLQPTLASADLCTTCTSSIMNAYINYETLCAYAPGLANSKLMSGQTALYKSITATCGTSFLGSLQAAGSLNKGLVSSGAEKTVAQFGVAATAVGALVMAFAAL